MAFSDIREEIPRTFFHIVGGFSLACIAWELDSPTNKIVLGAIFAVVITGEVARLTLPGLNRLTQALAGPVMRPGEKEGISGLPAFTGGVLAAFILFPKPVALAALVPLIFGDRAGLLVGKGVGRVKMWGKTLEGSLGCLTVSFLVYLFLAWKWSLVFNYSTGVLFAAALVGTLAEALPRPFDDNLTIPLAVGLFLTLAT
jgi:glycerol-3-phosphate acyltransferase PlsY